MLIFYRLDCNKDQDCKTSRVLPTFKCNNEQSAQRIVLSFIYCVILNQVTSVTLTQNLTKILMLFVLAPETLSEQEIEVNLKMI